MSEQTLRLDACQDEECSRMRCRATRALKQPSRAQTMAVTLAGKVAELNLGQYSPDLLKLAVRQAVNPAEAASHLREIQVGAYEVPPKSSG